MLHRDDAQFGMAFEYTVINHSPKKKLDRIGNSHHADFTSRSIVADFMEDPAIVAETRRYWVIMAVDSNVRDYGNLLIDEFCPDGIEVGVGEGTALIIAFIGIDGKAIATIGKALFYDFKRFFRAEAQRDIADRAHPGVILAEIAHRPIERTCACFAHVRVWTVIELMESESRQHQLDLITEKVDGA